MEGASRRPVLVWLCVVALAAGLGRAQEDADLIDELGDALMRSINPEALMDASRGQFQSLFQGLGGLAGRPGGPLVPGIGAVNFQQQMSSLLSASNMAAAFGKVGNFALPGNLTLEPFTDMFDAVKDKVCTAQTVAHCQKVPAVVLGPQFNITLSTGNCTLSHNGTTGLNLTCIGPAVSYSKAPITFVSKHKSADTFVDSSCVISKAFGQPQTKVLFTMGKDEVFKSTDAFLSSLTNGSMGPLWGFPAAGPSGAAAAATSPGGWKVVMAPRGAAPQEND